MIKLKLNQNGFSLVELVVYVALVALVGSLVLGLMIPMYKVGVEARVSRRINESGALMMERILRETKDAESVNQTGSVFSVNPGIFKINTTNASTTGGTMKFSLSAGRGLLTFGDGESQYLTSTQTNISELAFWYLVSSSSEAIRVKITISDRQVTLARERTFFGTAVLRGSYLSK